MSSPLVSVVLPAFNEAPYVERAVKETVGTLAGLGFPHEVIVVDDGSEDGTAELARAVAEPLPNVRVIGHEVNLGKGSALIRGGLAAMGDLVLFLDADLEVHPRQLRLLWEEMERTDADVVIGSKLHPDAQIDYPRDRRILSRGYYLLVRLLFRLPVHDTQTGLKLYRREVLARVLPRLVIKRYAHDLELLVNAHRLSYRIAEAPVVVTRVRPFERLGLRDAFHVAWDTAAIFYRTYVLRYYDRIGPRVDEIALGESWLLDEPVRGEVVEDSLGR
jgi:glycosyltransferase involved in cell wall biosynthesis